MEKFSQQQIKWENIRAVFSAITRAEAISRAEIAAQTELSLMTVGKLVEALDACGIAEQIKDEQVKAGRTARLVSLQSAWHMFVLDLTTRDFRMTVLDLACNILEEIVYPYDDTLFCEENLVLFLRNLPMYQLKQTDPAFCLGAGVLLPGAYDAEQDRMLGTNIPLHVPLNPRKTLTPLLPGKALTLMVDVQAAALSATVAPAKDEESQIWVSLDRPVCGALLLNGKPFFGAHCGSGRFGEITVGTNFTLDEAMLALTDQTERGAAVAIALYSLISALDPASIRIEARAPIFDEIFLDSLHGRLEQLNAGRTLPLPAITAEVRNVSSPVLGIARFMQEAWLKDRLLH